MSVLGWVRSLMNGGKRLAGRKVIVVGAGAAGLSATRALRTSGAEVILLEGSDRVGGRVRTLRDFADFPLELGAEEVHGTRSLWWELAGHAGAEPLDVDPTDYYVLDGRLVDEDEAFEDEAVEAAEAFFDSLGDYEGEEQVLSLRVIEEGLPERGWRLLEAWLHGDHGASTDQLGALAVAMQEQDWTSGGEDILLRGSYEDALLKVYRDEVALARTNRPVRAIRWDRSGVQVVTDGETLSADAVVLTVPLPLLRDGAIAMALPPDRRAAMARIGIASCTKAVLRFRKRFWPKEAGSIYGGARCSEYWCPTNGRGTTPVLTAYIVGRDAVALRDEPDPVRALLADLDGIFGEGVASGAFERASLVDWDAEPFAKGAFSYASPDSAEARAIVAAPLDGRVFFAGEATHTGGHFGTVHGAVETGLRAAEEVEQLVA